MMLQHLSSPSGASSNRCRSLCENPDGSRNAKSGVEAGTGVGDGTVEEVPAGAWIGFKGCRAAALFGEGDHGECISIGIGATPPAAGAFCAGGLLDTATAVLAVGETAPLSIARVGVVAAAAPCIDARDGADLVEVAAARPVVG